MISTMITKMEEEQQAEAAKQGKCVADLRTGEKDLSVKEKQMKALQARADKASARY